MSKTSIFLTRRLRATPYTRRVEAAGVKAYTVYNRMRLASLFDTPESDYWHLCKHVQLWDVACERQVELKGPDASKLAQLMTPRDLSKTDLLQGKYAPICDRDGFVLNDPIMIKLADDRWWVSIADSDVNLFAKGLAMGFDLDVKVFEPDVHPLAVQGPKADDLVARVFGEGVRSIRFFRGEMLPFQGVDMYVARSGWSKQGGFEIYLPDAKLGEPLWDALYDAGQDLNVRAGCPNGIERIESGLLSYGNDMDDQDTPFECGLDNFLNLQADIESLSIKALREKQGKHARQLVGLSFPKAPDLAGMENVIGGIDVYQGENYIGEIRSQAWSYRYNQHLVLMMMQRDYLAANDAVEIAGMRSEIHPVPFDLERLAQHE